MTVGNIITLLKQAETDVTYKAVFFIFSVSLRYTFCGLTLFDQIRRPPELTLHNGVSMQRVLKVLQLQDVWSVKPQESFTAGQLFLSGLAFRRCHTRPA